MPRTSYPPKAAADMLRIWFYIARDNAEIADRVEDELHEKFEALSKQPGLGHRRTDYTKSDVLFFPIYSYLIAYRPQTEPLEVVAVVHGSRQLKKVLRRRKA